MVTRFFKPGLAVANHAESGESIRSSLGAHRFDKIFSTIRPGDYLFVQFGHNDMKDRATNAGAVRRAAQSPAGPRQAGRQLNQGCLHIELVTNIIRLSWPALATDFFLESATSLSPIASWSSNAVTPTVFGSSNVVTLPADQRLNFYRLRR